MTPAKLSFNLLAACLLGMIVVSSAYFYPSHPYGADSFAQCGTDKCYIDPDRSTSSSYKCPEGCGCISDRYNYGEYTGWGKCWKKHP
uniref:Putative secreted protein n=1 Tax=Amblyomma americanum TaxID=6943 RepID=A0A0C9SCR3_AMBAM